MPSKQEASTPDGAHSPQGMRVAARPLQLSLSLFPQAPGRPLTAVATHTGAAPRLRQSERAGDGQRALPIRGPLSV